VLFDPRLPQKLMIAHGLSRPRVNIHASPGLGKTVSAYTVLDTLSLVADPYPALVIGPKRVANSVWTREAMKWDHLHHLTIDKAIGTEVERRAALRNLADVTTIHYGLLSWLIEQYKGKPWPFRTVIPDEATRLKHARPCWRRNKGGKPFLQISGGSSNAGALARRADQTAFWINMTGTPAPNGLKDLWAPQWFIDFGETLGNSYTAFTNRWFYQRRGTDKEQAIFEPHAHAHDEITRRIKPTTISLNAYDYFDIARPREVDIEIELPEDVMKQYRKLHREAVLKLSEEKTITAVNAGVVTGKCLQFASGHVFDSDQVAHFIHDEKLQALESLIENLNGAPLLVAYNFTPDRDAILRRFKFAELLPSDHRQQAVEDRWNRGEIPLLLVHPASAGHGLNLQYGGCDLCVYSGMWDLELYEQIIERIGPVRQMQAGLKRLVNVYRLIATHTFDKVTFDRLRSKSDVQQAVMEATRA
jgi:SNF2 family DNA or RNA helicase